LRRLDVHAHRLRLGCEFIQQRGQFFRDLYARWPV
jgi:hypothetical protein